MCLLGHFHNDVVTSHSTETWLTSVNDIIQSMSKNSQCDEYKCAIKG